MPIIHIIIIQKREDFNTFSAFSFAYENFNREDIF